MSKGSEAVKKWRANAKEKLVQAFGGKCCICGYNKSVSLEFHHINPLEKDGSWGSFRGDIKSWSTIVEEMKKCAMVCSNCHKEIHGNITQLPENYPRLDESLVTVAKVDTQDQYDDCPVCGNKKHKKLFTCSKICSGKNKNRLDWDNIDLVALYNTHKSFSKISEILNVSDKTVALRYKRALKV